jgi:hypothetical protein
MGDANVVSFAEMEHIVLLVETYEQRTGNHIADQAFHHWKFLCAWMPGTNWLPVWDSFSRRRRRGMYVISTMKTHHALVCYSPLAANNWRQWSQVWLPRRWIIDSSPQAVMVQMRLWLYNMYGQQVCGILQIRKLSSTCGWEIHKWNRDYNGQRTICRINIHAQNKRGNHWSCKTNQPMRKNGLRHKRTRSIKSDWRSKKIILVRPRCSAALIEVVFRTRKHNIDKC